MPPNQTMSELRLQRLHWACANLPPASLEWLETLTEFLAGNIHVSDFRHKVPDTPELPSEAPTTLDS